MKQTEVTFKAFVDAIIPRTPELAEEYGRIQYFGALDLHTDEYLALSLNYYYFSYLPIAFKNNPELVLFSTGELNSLTMMGYYSEWSGYGSTRLNSPNHRKLEYFPLSWKQIGYPGPSSGYRALRK